LKVNKVTTDVGYAAFSRGGAFLGDYNQLATASNGTTYVAHNEALPRTPGEKCNCSFTRGNGHQHQYTYVAVIGKRVGRSGARAATGNESGRSSGGNAAGGAQLAATGLRASLPVAGVLLLVAAATLRRRTPSCQPLPLP
jgi:hypothetical protein